MDEEMLTIVGLMVAQIAVFGATYRYVLKVWTDARFPKVLALFVFMGVLFICAFAVSVMLIEDASVAYWLWIASMLLALPMFFIDDLIGFGGTILNKDGLASTEVKSSSNVANKKALEVLPNEAPVGQDAKPGPQIRRKYAQRLN